MTAPETRAPASASASDVGMARSDAPAPAVSPSRAPLAPLVPLTPLADHPDDASARWCADGVCVVPPG